MDKNVQLNQFGIIADETTTIVVNGVEVTVSKTIPYERVLDAIQWCIDYIIYDKPFISGAVKTIIMELAILQFWTDIDFKFLETIKQISELYEAYDIVAKNGVFEKVRAQIDNNQLVFFYDNTEATLTSIIAYRNSAQGIVDILSENAANNSAEIEQSLSYLNDDEKSANIAKIINAAASLS